MIIKQVIIVAAPDSDSHSIANYIWKTGDDPAILAVAAAALTAFSDNLNNELRTALMSQQPINPS